MKNRLFPTKPLPLRKPFRLVQFGQESFPRFVQFGQESCPAGEYLHSERLWMLEKVSAALNTTLTTIPHISKNPQKKKKKKAGEYLHSERLWMLEKMSAALKNTPTTIPQTPHISKNPQKKKKLENTFTQSGCGCLKKCLQLSKLLPLPSHKLHTFPKTHKKKKRLMNNFVREAEGCR